jgi:hypothetical protein
MMAGLGFEYDCGKEVLYDHAGLVRAFDMHEMVTILDNTLAHHLRMGQRGDEPVGGGKR